MESGSGRLTHRSFPQTRTGVSACSVSDSFSYLVSPVKRTTGCRVWPGKQTPGGGIWSESESRELVVSRRGAAGGGPAKGAFPVMFVASEQSSESSQIRVQCGRCEKEQRRAPRRGSTNSDVYAPECECETLCTSSDPPSLVRACARLALRSQAVAVVASLAVLVDCTAHHVVGTAPRPLDEPCSRPGSCNPRVRRTHRHFPRSTRGRSERAEAAKGEEAEKGRRPRAGHGQPRTEPGTRVPREQGRTL